MPSVLWNFKAALKLRKYYTGQLLQTCKDIFMQIYIKHTMHKMLSIPSLFFPLKSSSEVSPAGKHLPLTTGDVGKASRVLGATEIGDFNTRTALKWLSWAGTLGSTGECTAASQLFLKKTSSKLKASRVNKLGDNAAF